MDPALRVLKARDYATARKAEATLIDAQQHSEAILIDAQNTYKEEKARGRDEGLAEAQGEVAEQILNVVSRSVDYLAGAEAEVASIVLTCLRKILGDFSDEELVIREARTALQVVRNEPRVTLRVSTDVEREVRERVGEILSGNGGVNFLEVVGDDRIGKGGCLLESEAGVVDASIQQQLDALEEALSARVNVSSSKA
ncbi:MAG: HrpE/YscL family type III secretion apparatus protein [Pseudomonadota bacterium]